jgi:hypothetical protein
MAGKQFVPQGKPSGPAHLASQQLDAAKKALTELAPLVAAKRNAVADLHGRIASAIASDSKASAAQLLTLANEAKQALGLKK